MKRVKKNVPRKGDIFFGGHSGIVIVSTGVINHAYGLLEFEYVGIDGIIYTYGCDKLYLLNNFNKVSI